MNTVWPSPYLESQYRNPLPNYCHPPCSIPENRNFLYVWQISALWRIIHLYKANILRFQGKINLYRWNLHKFSIYLNYRHVMKRYGLCLGAPLNRRQPLSVILWHLSKNPSIWFWVRAKQRLDMVFSKKFDQRGIKSWSLSLLSLTPNNGLTPNSKSAWISLLHSGDTWFLEMLRFEWMNEWAPQ